MKTVFIIGIVLITLIHAGLTDDAYSVYKNGDKRKAFQLYAKGDKAGNLKATYNLAVFYEKGIGTEKNLSKALKLYKKVIHSIRNSDDYCSSSQQRYYKKTYKKLGEYENDPTYLQKLKKLENDCKYIKNPWRDEDSAFIKKCPSARVIPEKDRKAIYIVPCEYFKRYPRLMKKYMPLYQQVNRSISYGEISEEQYKKAQKEIRTLVHPLLRDLKKKEISCYKKAKTIRDDEKCYTDYIGDLDILFGTDMIGMYNEGMYYYPNEKDRKRIEAEDKARKKKVLTEQKRKKSIQKAQEELRKNDLLPEDLKLIFKLP